MSGYPTVRIDGLLEVSGAGGCVGAANQYRAKINDRLTETGGLSPVAMSSHMETSPTSVTITATYRLVDPVSLVDLRATLLLYEDNVYWCCGYGGVDTWQHTTRKIYDQNITLTDVGDEATVVTTIPVQPSWNPNELHAVAYLQQTSGSKQIIQGRQVGYGMEPDYSLWFPFRVRSIPAGNGTATFDAVLTNISEATDTYTLQPGTLFGDWTTDFLVCGDNTPHSEPVQVVLDPDESCEFTVRVHTDGSKEIRSGTFLVTSLASGRTHTTTMRVFNGSYSVFLVDDDASQHDEMPLVRALDALGYLYETWDIYNGHANSSPGYGNMAGFDYVIWQTAWRFTSLLTDADIDALKHFMDDGGSLFLTSQEFLDTQTGPTAFITDYLGVASWTLDKGYDHLFGVVGDPIGDGLDLPLSFQYPSFKQGDDAVPGPTAVTAIRANDGSSATVRNQMGRGAKSVFMPSAFNAISETGADPNNTRVVLGRILDWLKPEVPAEAEDLPTAAWLTRIEGARPNPFNPRTEIHFVLSPAAAAEPVYLGIFDLAGRRLADLLHGRLTAGSHVRTWNGRTEEGEVAQSGVYFVRLTTREGVRSTKLVVLK